VWIVLSLFDLIGREDGSVRSGSICQETFQSL
jgi:hypothetical protein